MAAIANIVINDGAAVPVAHTLSPVSSGISSKYRDSVANLPVFGQIALSVVTKLDTGSGLNKVRCVLELPVMETVGTASGSGYVAGPRVAFSVKANLDLILPSRSTLQNRKDLRVLLIAALANAQVVDAIDSLSPPY